VPYPIFAETTMTTTNTDAPAVLSWLFSMSKEMDRFPYCVTCRWRTSRSPFSLLARAMYAVVQRYRKQCSSIIFDPICYVRRGAAITPLVGLVGSPHHKLVATIAGPTRWFLWIRSNAAKPIRCFARVRMCKLPKVVVVRGCRTGLLAVACWSGSPRIERKPEF